MNEEHPRLSELRPPHPHAGETACCVAWCTPPVDIYENEHEVILVADMPGVAPADLEIDVSQDTLSISGRVAQDDEPCSASLTEYGRTSFYRSFHLSRRLDTQRMTANLKDGILRVTIGKSKNTGPRKIPVKNE